MRPSTLEPSKIRCTIPLPIGDATSHRRKPRSQHPRCAVVRVHTQRRVSREREPHMRTKSIVVFLFLTLTLLPIVGCADLQGAIAQTSAWRDEASTLRADLTKQLNSLQLEQQHTPPGSATSTQLESRIKLVQAKHAALDAAIAQADEVLREAQQPTDALTTIAHGVSAWVPAPAQGPLVLGAALIATLARSRQLKQSSTSIIQSISHVLERDEQFRSLFSKHSDTIRSIQTPAARKLVDQTQQRRTPVIPF